MVAYRYEEMNCDKFKKDAERRLAYSDHLMMAVMDFYYGPQSEPDPPHTHPHEQVSYVAQGEIIFFLEDKQTHLKAGDVFVVPSGLPHSIQLLTEHARLVDCFTPLREDFLNRG
jgi:quercetin dioxygenase-like cupin family protein